MNSEGKHIAAYVRVSTVEQNEAGQTAAIQRWLIGNGYPSGQVTWYVDKATGTDFKRPEFERMQEAVFNGEVDAIVIWKLDRLSRNLLDGLNVLCDWIDRDIRIVSVTQQIDMSGTVGKMLAAVLLGIAEMEQEMRRERQQVGIEAAKARGVYKGGRNRGHRKGSVKRAKYLARLGLSQHEIANALGVSQSTVHNYLSES